MPSYAYRQVPETVLVHTVLESARALIAEGKQVRVHRLRCLGVRGDNKRILACVRALIATGELPAGCTPDEPHRCEVAPVMPPPMPPGLLSPVKRRLPKRTFRDDILEANCAFRSIFGAERAHAIGAAPKLKRRATPCP